MLLKCFPQFSLVLHGYASGAEDLIPEFSSGNCSQDSLGHANNINRIIDENWTKILDLARGPALRARRRITTAARVVHLQTIVDEPDSD